MIEQHGLNSPRPSGKAQAAAHVGKMGRIADWQRPAGEYKQYVKTPHNCYLKMWRE